MFVTPLNIEQVLDRFYNQSKYDLMLLFVSSFDGNDIIILNKIVDNAKRIDRITGERICFFYFVKDTYDSMNESLTRWVKDISDWTPLYGEGVSITMETADDICRLFGILHSNLPAFILVSKDKQKEPHVLTIRDYQDFESLLTPLNILHSYIEDREFIISHYQQELQKYQDLIRLREKWANTLRELEAKREESVELGMVEQAEECKLGIEKLRERLRESPLQPSEENKEQNLILLENKTIDRLNMSLNSQDGKSIVKQIQSRNRYASVVIKIFELVGTRGIRLSKILSRIRTEIYERGFDVFISCKSQDYGLAYDLYNFLISNGFKPFLADASIKEVGIDQYTALIGEVINVCQYMVVFATDTSYLETPYVAAEWHTFINDINTGHKPKAKIVSILSPDINPHFLPAWLRDKQCFTTENYKQDLIPFLSDRDDETIENLRDEINSRYYRIRKEVSQLQFYHGEHNAGDLVWRYMDRIEQEKIHIDHQLFECKMSHYISYEEHKHVLKKIHDEALNTASAWEIGLIQLTKDLQQSKRFDEKA